MRQRIQINAYVYTYGYKSKLRALWLILKFLRKGYNFAVIQEKYRYHKTDVCILELQDFQTTHLKSI